MKFVTEIGNCPVSTFSSNQEVLYGKCCMHMEVREAYTILVEESQGNSRHIR